MNKAILLVGKGKTTLAGLMCKNRMFKAHMGELFQNFSPADLIPANTNYVVFEATEEEVLTYIEDIRALLKLPNNYTVVINCQENFVLGQSLKRTMKKFIISI